MKVLLPLCNKRICAGFAVLLLLGGCSGTPKRMAENAESAKPAAEAATLPREYDNALVLMQSGDYQAAIPVLQAFIDNNPGLAGPYVNLGIAHQHNGQNDAALAALKKALELNPANAAAHHQLGILYREQGEFEAALTAYDNALKLDGDYALAHRNVGILYDLYLQQPALALDHYKKYLELAGEPDKTVGGWVIDLERRNVSAQARAGQ